MVSTDPIAPDELLVAALAAHDAGLSVVRVRADGTKAPAGQWKQYQSSRAERAVVEEWFTPPALAGLGVICGAVSGDLEMIELEGRLMADDGSRRFATACRRAGLELLLRRLVNGFAVSSPSGGLHLYYRVDGPAVGNTKLARNAAHETLIETRGEGGFVVLPPSSGTVHPSGKPWRVRAPHNSFAAMPTITVAERDALHAVARSFDEAPAPIVPSPVEVTQRAPHRRYAGGAVGGSWMDAVEAHLSATWTMLGLLEHYGWTRAYVDRHGRMLVTRPGKDDGVSGSVNPNDRLAVFSTSTPFVAYTGVGPAPTYGLLDVVAAYEHAGDRQEAGRRIATETGILAHWQAERSPVLAVRTPAGIDPETGEVEQPRGGLDDDFWGSRPVLDHIRTAARSRLVAPAALLGAVLARVAAFTPPSTCLPPLVGGEAPLSLFVGLHGRSGAGKSSPISASADLLPDVPPGCVGPLALGSGEGLVEAFMDLVEETDGAGKKRKVKRQVHHGALFSLDEGQVLAEISNRRGSTVLPVLRTAWSGGDPGQANASIETRRSLRPGSYVVGLVSLWQDKAAATLMADADGGTPQRFVWLPTGDAGATTCPPDWPGRLRWAPPAMIAIGGKVGRDPLDVALAIRTEIIEARVAGLRGEDLADPLDAHRRLCKLKLAGLLAVLEERHAIDVEDWELAERIMATSDNVRAWILHEARRRQAEAAIAEAERTVTKDVIIERSATERALASAAKAAYRAAAKAGGHPVTKRVIHAAITSRDRQHVTAADAIAEAERLRWITPTEDGSLNPGWLPGEARPA